MEKIFRIALAGCGRMAHAWVRNALAREDAEIVALVDIRMEAARQMAEQYGLSCGCFTNLEQAIRDSGANLVFDVTVPEARKQVVTTAVRNGCHVFAEKPMAATPEDLDTIEKEVKKSGKRYAVMQNRRYMRQIRAFRSLIEKGVIGKPGFLTAQFFLAPHFGGFRDAMDSPLLLDMAIHTFDQARLIMGADPVSVYCHEFNPPGSWYAGNAAASCIFEFDNGCVFSYNGSWCAEGAPTSWEASWRMVGSRGTAVWDGHDMPWAEAVSDSEPPSGGLFRECRKVEAPEVWHGRENHDGCLDEMFASLLENREAETSYTDNKKSVMMVFKALESAGRAEKKAGKPHGVPQSRIRIAAFS